MPPKERVRNEYGGDVGKAGDGNCRNRGMVRVNDVNVRRYRVDARRHGHRSPPQLLGDRPHALGVDNRPMTQPQESEREISCQNLRAGATGQGYIGDENRELPVAWLTVLSFLIDDKPRLFALVDRLRLRATWRGSMTPDCEHGSDLPGAARADNVTMRHPLQRA